ncbi:cation diffusion facilitator family transporter [Arenibacter sp. GZD96]|uniref:cation diffusion facilitator family transporter n=1 Tax=Aurantibrevibacter litoralis TaxID=3106030 RepID=UPI002AFFCC5C|nr:cation diffusion facilitator family transporter [Arenibacter sp. GZD-96]MEA1785720.1 cation diffusion facilitator family transporter [Arenibacter sp. GZD-96]
MGHSHHHHHHHASDVKGKNLVISIVLNVLITVAQIVGGLFSGSLALLSDALHNFSDVISLVLSYAANVFAKEKASHRHTFGFKRAEIMAAFINSATLMVVAVFLIIEAIERLITPREIEGNVVLWLALLGILANGFSVLLLKKDAALNMNIKSAYLHLLTDMMASVAVLVGGVLITFYKVYWIDAVLTMLIAGYLIYMGYDLLKASTKVLMLASPETIEVSAIVDTLSAIAPIKNVHHVHIWQLNDHTIHLEAHIDFNQDILLSEFDAVLTTIEETLGREYGISHFSIQPEFGKCSNKEIIVQE